MPVKPYRTLMSVVVEHDYFGTGRARGLRFTADDATVSRLKTPRWAVRIGDAELVVAVDADWQSRGDAEPLRFLAWADDPSWFRVCEPFVFAEDRLLRFATKRGFRERDGRRRLHKAQKVGRGDLRVPPADARPHPLVTAKRPVFELIVDPHMDAAACVVRFGARRTYWTYYLTGVDSLGPLRLVDADAELAFEPLGETPLANAQSAKTFRSTQPVALRERSDRRLQVRERRGAAERVIVRRLPGPSLQLAPIPGRRDGSLQSEVYVNL